MYRSTVDWRQDSIDLADRHLNFALIRAPFATVVPVVGGIMRATGPAVVVKNGIKEPPIKRGQDANGGWAHQRRCLVSRLPDPSLTLIETSPVFTLARAVSMMLSRVECFDFTSDYEARDRWAQDFAVFQGGTRTRFVSLEQGFESLRVSFEEQGTPLPFEQTDRYADPDLPQRLTRTMQLEYATACGLNVDRQLMGRSLSETTEMLDKSGNHPECRGRASTDFVAEMARARQLGMRCPDEEPGPYAATGG